MAKTIVTTLKAKTLNENKDAISFNSMLFYIHFSLKVQRLEIKLVSTQTAQHNVSNSKLSSISESYSFSKITSNPLSVLD